MEGSKSREVMVLDCCDKVAWEDGSHSTLADSSGARFLKKSQMDFLGVGVGGGFSRRMGAKERLQLCQHLCAFGGPMCISCTMALYDDA